MKSLVHTVEHYPVLVDEVVAALDMPLSTILDCTFGHGGHARAILQKFPQVQRYSGLDRDAQTVAWHRQNPLPAVEVTHGNFMDSELVSSLKPEAGFCAILVDLGTSQFQLQTGSRGFSFLREGPLDMRMDTSQGATLKQWLQSVDENTLGRIISEYGEERFAFRVAKAIMRERDNLNTTLELAKVIENAIPWANRRDQKNHAATRTFQALRIAVNDELSQLENTLEHLMPCLRAGGKLLVISFHSLEDRIVKTCMRRWETPETEPVFYGPPKVIRAALGRCKPHGAIKPTAAEIATNSPSRSARLRIFERQEYEI